MLCPRDLSDQREKEKGIDSALWSDIPALFWNVEELSGIDMTRPAGVELSVNDPIPDGMPTLEFFGIIRDGLTHGNIFIKGPGDHHIANLTFGKSVEKDTDNYKFITISVENFRQMLLEWVELLRQTPLKSGTIPTTDAAD